jgi:hypothetical protein
MKPPPIRDQSESSQISQSQGFFSKLLDLQGQSPTNEWNCCDSPRFKLPNSWSLNRGAAWENDRNANHTTADWQFTTADARIKLKNLYPSIC